MNLNLNSERRARILNEIDEEIRIKNAPKSDAETTFKFLTDMPISAMVQARLDFKMGQNLEKTCPYIRVCDLQHSPVCIGKDNYRKSSCYVLKLFNSSEVLDSNA